MFSCVGSSGRSWPSWNTKPKRRRRRVDKARSDMVVISSPSRVIDPELGRSTPARQCRRVVLPEPEGPMIATCVPCGSVRSTPASAWTGVFRACMFSSVLGSPGPRCSQSCLHVIPEAHFTSMRGCPGCPLRVPRHVDRDGGNLPSPRHYVNHLSACGILFPHLTTHGHMTDRIGFIRSDCQNGITPRRAPWVWKI